MAIAVDSWRAEIDPGKVTIIAQGVPCFVFIQFNSIQRVILKAKYQGLGQLLGTKKNKP